MGLTTQQFSMNGREYTFWPFPLPMPIEESPSGETIYGHLTNSRGVYAGLVVQSKVGFRTIRDGIKVSPGPERSGLERLDLGESVGEQFVRRMRRHVEVYREAFGSEDTDTVIDAFGILAQRPEVLRELSLAAINVLEGIALDAQSRADGGL